MPPSGYTPQERLPSTENLNASLNMALQYNPLSFQTDAMLGFQEGFISDPPATYLHENPINMPPEPPPQQTQGRPSNERVKMESSFALVSPTNSGSPGRQNSSRSVPGNQPPPLTMHEFNLKIPNTARSRGRGRGKGNTGADSEHQESVKRGKGRAATQGVLVPIVHVGRQEALAEQAAKRKRVDQDEPYDDSDERALEDLTSEMAEVPQKKQKSEAPTKGSKRGHSACDRCVRNKTKVIFLLLLF
jgi:hypothetical protein